MPKDRVLVVDDEAIVRESIQDWLEDAGYEVETAESGEEALEKTQKKVFSVMVLDLRLPGESGLSVLAKVKANQPWIKSIIITAYPSEETVAEARRLGAIDYLIKPVAPEDLERLIRETLESVGREDQQTRAATEVRLKLAEAAKALVITGEGLKALVEGLLNEMEVIGVKPRQGKFVYDKINCFDELCLNYDVTELPPTKFLLPAKETLLKFKVGSGAQFEQVVDLKPRALVGVHPDDVNAIELLDDVFMTVNPDPNYIARRQNTLIIGVDCLNPSPQAFSPSMGTSLAQSGFDLLLTDIGTGWVVTVGSQTGSEILFKYASPREITGEEIAKQKKVRDEALRKYQCSLNVPKERLPKILEENYDNPYWEARSKSCLSCGSCVMVCPTCFCFDVRDDVALNMKEGERYRTWDGCVLTDFARVATGQNFRHDKTSRFRHRMFCKGKYILEKYGRPGCVGCGRCAIACLPGIASPVEAFNAIAESSRPKSEAVRLLKETKEVPQGLYLPRPARLLHVKTLGPREKLFDFEFTDGKSLGHEPGQFVEVSIPGIGEAPISISSSPTRDHIFQLAIRNVGGVTGAINELNEGDITGIRGPYGNGFPLEFLKSKDVLLIAGGIGLFSLRSLLQYVLDNREQYGRVVLLFGARSPGERVLADELAELSRNPNLEFLETLDKGDESWKGHVGVITTLIPLVKVDPKKTVGIVVGPPVMYRFVISELKKLGLPDENIILSLERRMKCGVGKCGHCQVNGVYVCQEGPAFSLAQLRNLREAV